MTAMPPIPQGLPPFFLAVAQDDTLAGPAVARFFDALKAAGYKPELHVFSSGGHGFGMRKQADRAITGSTSSTTGWRRKG